MKLDLKKQFIAFDEFSSPECLPKFTLITGVNGAGKTRLLNGILRGEISIDLEEKNDVKVRLYNPNNLIPKNEPLSAIPDLSEEKNKFSVLLDSLKPVYFKNLRATLAQRSPQTHGALKDLPQEFTVEDILELNTKYGLNIEERYVVQLQQTSYKKVIDEVLAHPKNINTQQRSNPAQQELIRFQTEIKEAVTDDIMRLINWMKQDEISLAIIFDFIAKKSNKQNVMYVSHEEFIENYPQTVMKDPFRRTFTDWFIKYFISHRENAAKLHLKEDGALSDEDFKKRYGELPWVFLQ